MAQDYSVFPVDPDLLPIRFSSPVRISDRYAKNWGLPVIDPKLDALADTLYETEWTGGGDMQHIYVGDAAEEAGLGNYSKMMQNWAARVAGHLICDLDTKASVLDVGAGAGDSIIALYKYLGDPDRFFAYLLEPSEKKKGVMMEKLGKRGLKPEKHYKIITARDIDVVQKLNPDSVDIAMQVAAVHHHRNRRESFRQSNKVVKKGGYYVSADWHSHIWMTPSMVYHCLLKNMEWPQKEAGMKAFLKAFPDAKEAPPNLGHYSRNEVFTFSKYWQAWNERRQKEIAAGNFDPRDDFFGVEGQCPALVYEQEFNEAGFSLKTPRIFRLEREGIIDGNPEQIVPNHNLDIGMVAQETKKVA